LPGSDTRNQRLVGPDGSRGLDALLDGAEEGVLVREGFIVADLEGGVEELGEVEEGVGTAEARVEDDDVLGVG
jgi:hypothetical protein